MLLLGLSPVILARGFPLGGSAGPVPVLLGLPAIAGVPQPGSVLSGTVGTWSGADAFAWAWQADAGTGWSDIAGAAGTGAAVAGLALTAADRGRSVRLRVRASNAAGGRTAVSEPVAVPASGAFSTGFSAAFAA